MAEEAAPGSPTWPGRFAHFQDYTRQSLSRLLSVVGCWGGGTWSLTLSALDLVAEGGDVLQEASVDWRELAVRDVCAAFFSDVLRGEEEPAHALDACIFQRGHQCS